jgi:hypothetical protein
VGDSVKISSNNEAAQIKKLADNDFFLPIISTRTPPTIKPKAKTINNFFFWVEIIKNKYQGTLQMKLLILQDTLKM